MNQKTIVVSKTEVIERTISSLQKRGMTAVEVDNRQEALDKIKEIIPAGASVMNGSSVTLDQIGFIDYLKSGKHPWKNLHETILAEQDPVKQEQLRREATSSDYYLGSVHALAETGELLIASNTGSQLPHIAYTSPNLIFVVSAKKIVPTMADTHKRLMEVVIPLEEARMQKLYGFGTMLNKILILNGEAPFSQRKILVIIVNEDLGF